MSITKGNKRLYSTLCCVLDGIRAEATPFDQTYNPPSGNADALIQARSRALLHLFLKARFGLISFEARSKYVTDGQYDGGIDAYYIDSKKKIIYVLQSKFRATAGNFVENNMSVGDILKMEVGRILKGERQSDDGHPYNPKIVSLQKEIRKLVDAASFTKQVVLLGNTKDLTAAQLRKLVGDYPVEQFAHHRIYSDLLFPVVTGTYYNDPNLTIQLNLSNVRGEPHLNYDARTKYQKTNIKLIFVPTQEVGRILSTYRNSILKFNPRSFLELDKNAVNKEIEQSIRNKTTNEFALYNNGITIITDNTSFSSDTARQGMGQLVLLNPQLVNGAQTAYTLARIYDECAKAKNFAVFKGKEVLLKLITFLGAADNDRSAARLDLIGSISKASNSQTKVDDYDRRSSDPVQRELQKELFQKHGLFYERKRGEFSDGLNEGSIDSSLMVNRESLIRVSLACDFKVSQARSSLARFATEDALADRLKVGQAAKYAYGYEVLNGLKKARSKKPVSVGDRYHVRSFGQALRYGQYSVIAVCTNHARNKGHNEEQGLDAALRQWPTFEAWASNLRTNSQYKDEDGSFDFVNYYKGGTIGSDLQQYNFTF
jgi:hypothetical protein